MKSGLTLFSLLFSHMVMASDPCNEINGSWWGNVEDQTTPNTPWETIVEIYKIRNDNVRIEFNILDGTMGAPKHPPYGFSASGTCKDGLLFLSEDNYSISFTGVASREKIKLSNTNIKIHLMR